MRKAWFDSVLVGKESTQAPNPYTDIALSFVGEVPLAAIAGVELSDDDPATRPRVFVTELLAENDWQEIPNP